MGKFLTFYHSNSPPLHLFYPPWTVYVLLVHPRGWTGGMYCTQSDLVFPIPPPHSSGLVMHNPPHVHWVLLCISYTYIHRVLLCKTHPHVHWVMLCISYPHIHRVLLCISYPYIHRVLLCKTHPHVHWVLLCISYPRIHRVLLCKTHPHIHWVCYAKPTPTFIGFCSA
jgi:hypothetical protein